MTDEMNYAATVAQWIEHRPSKPAVGGSNPSGCAKITKGDMYG